MCAVSLYMYMYVLTVFYRNKYTNTANINIVIITIHNVRSVLLGD